MFSKTLPLLLASLVLPSVSALYPTRNVYQYPEIGNWLENIAVRPNGLILVTSLERPGTLLQIDPQDCKAAPKTVYKFQGFNSTAGITEADGSPDVFYVAVSNASLENLNAQEGSNWIYRVSFNGTNGAPKVQHIAHITNATIVNGLLAINPTTLLAADFRTGIIFSIDIPTGTYQEAITDKLFMASENAPYTINGLKLRKGDKKTLYFTSTANNIFGRVPIHTNGMAAGKAVKLASSDSTGGNYDDFAFDTAGNAYATTGGGNSIQKITFGPKGNVRRVAVVAGNLNSTAIAEPSGAAFGRTEWDKDILYVTTGGALGIPVIQNGQEVRVGAQIVAVKVR